MNWVPSFTEDEVNLIVSALAERAVNEMDAGRISRAHEALDLAEKLGVKP